MAQLIRTDTAIVFKLSLTERIVAFHFRPVEVSLQHVRSVVVAEDIWTKVRGIRPPFTWLKDHFAIGTRRGLFGKDFTAVYGLRPGVVVEFEGGEWARFAATVDYPDDIAHLLRG